ncbi:hypothetical protein KXW98_001134 [Aspergillus fumigatus]|uniref:Lysophospholipase A, putative n=3 Tax=Aspergillus fumigatus TaxID=746128 RepID=Q4X194_ASPFU|nr:lysophospholipase A, putative [Aspergillus fumigatus Af293]EDP54595.1 lysophospholipase A, putative [Aspergillus fumigatus A1163]KAF4267478.1 hypothetical protein CNMCM8714_003358 [Aspergillus fumigatus]KMK61924.1 lysophospholipase A [Aspergillus fumigatus Z5]EAL93371.1 lysophospholipase A, putative [Aspergillus fumigatus Af293]KAF4269885.1 hypothetical protein CNMCM8057_008044 [Aspergillus fumigatus]
MIAITRNLALATLAFGAAALPPQLSCKNAFDWDATRYLLTFGDSYTYVQGTHGHQNYSFIGDQLNFEYDWRTLLSNKIVQNQTATAEGGPNWVEFLTNCGVKKGLTSPLSCEKQLWDFAFAGADISIEYTPLHHNYTVSLVNQVIQYEQYGHPVLKNIIHPSRTLVAIWIGINDINDSAKYAVHFPTLYNRMMTTLFTSVQTLYNLGYRSYLFMNLPPLDRTPANQARSNPSPNATQITWFNNALSQHAMSFARAHPNATVQVFDAHTALSNMMDHPAQYGIVNTTNFCAGYNQPDIETNYLAYGCPTPLDTYFWFNSGHLTSHVHKELAEILEAQLKSCSR